MPGHEILVVDDDRQTVLMLQHFLSRDGYRVHIASDGRQALDFLELGARTGKLPDLVILDMYVTYSDGFQVLRTIGDELGPKQRVLMLSVQARDEDIVKAFELGAMDFVTKPFSIDVVRARVRNLLRCERIA